MSRAADAHPVATSLPFAGRGPHGALARMAWRAGWPAGMTSTRWVGTREPAAAGRVCSGWVPRCYTLTGRALQKIGDAGLQ
jgi:hypothetical protein